MELGCGVWRHLERELGALVGTEDLVVVCLGDISQGTWFVGRNWKVALASAEGPKLCLKDFDTESGEACPRLRTSQGREEGGWEVG